MLAKRITGIGNLNEYINGVEVKACKFLKRELTPAAWDHYKKELEIGNKFFKDDGGRFFGMWTGESNLFFIGRNLQEVNDYLLWE